jgi:Tol biopolymer transport system component
MKLPIEADGSLQNPAPDPTGKRICFTRFRNRYNGGRSDIGIYDLEKQTTHFIALAGEANVSQPGSCWNERGLIFSSDGYGGPDRACCWDGKDVHVLYKPTNAQTWEPSLGPDFYVAERHNASGGGNGVIVGAHFANLDDIKEITEPDRDCRQPCVSPDGKLVLFQEHIDGSPDDDESGSWHLLLHDLGSGNETTLPSGTDATFSHDGKRVVFSAEDGRLRVLTIATRIVMPVRVETPYSGAPSFSRDDKKIYYEGGRKGDDGGPPSAIYVTDAP